MEKVEIQDLFNYRFIHSLAASGKHILCLQTQMDKVENGYHTQLMELNPSTMQLKPLISDGSITSFCFEDEASILFAAQRQTSDKPRTARAENRLLPLVAEAGRSAESF